MSKVQIATGEIIVRKDKKQRFIIVEDKYEFDDDTWSVIKSYMGLIDFDKIQTQQDYFDCAFKIRQQLEYYIKQIPMKTRGLDGGLDKFMTIISMNISSRMFFTYGYRFATYYDKAREEYAFVSLALTDFKNCRMVKPRTDGKYTRVAVGFQDKKHIFIRNGDVEVDSFRIRRNPDTKRLEYKTKKGVSRFTKEFIKERYLLKRNENWLQKKYCK